MFSASKTAAPVSGGYQVSNSLRFRSSASAYLSRTPSVAGNRQTWTWSAWVKFGNLGLNQNLFGATTDNYNVDYFALYGGTTSNVLRFENVSGGATQLGANITSQVFRDPSAWYHIILAIDTTQATASNRVKFYVNGVQVTNWAQTSYPAQNAVLLVNSTIQHDISSSNAGLAKFDGYMAEVNFIDGQALTPSSFGSINATTGVWQPARYTGSYGTNGFYLKFNSGTSTTTLGNDSSGNGNNWTTNNISLTAGSTYDWMLDSPTSYAGSSYGVGNYAVLNPLDKGSEITTANGNLSVSWSGVTGHSIRSSFSVNSGQSYCEFTMGSSAVSIGLIAQNISGVGSSSGWPGSSTFGVGGSYAYANNGNKYTNSTSTAYGASYTSGDVIGIAFDATAGTLTFYKNGSSQGTAFTGISGAYCFAIGYFGGSTGGTPANVNFGQRPFAYTPPTGFKSLCTQNLPAPTIYNGANHMAATTYTGTGSSLSISNSVNSASFQPDLVWIKSRSAATDNKLTDSVRGVTKGLISNTTGAETTDTTGLTAFGASGFTVGASTTYNNSGSTYVGWQWKAGGTAVTNTAGSITSSVSANTTAGFSIVRYLNNGVASTVGHGLGIAPSMIIIKNKTVASIAGTNTEWAVYHSALGASGQVFLNLTNANTTAYSLWNSTSPTANVFSVAAFDYVNSAYPGSSGTYTYIAYCFAAIPGYSAFGSYTGNGSADGPFVYCGFRPRFILVKRADTAGYPWVIFDTSRSTYNVITAELYPNTSAAEANSSNDFDIVSNGFKCRIAAAAYNASGGTYIYAAFCESPFQNSLAR